jgi:hypothetical protein
MAAVKGQKKPRMEAEDNEEGWSWIGAPLSKAERAKEYPDRFVAKEIPAGYTVPTYDNSYPAAMVSLISA